MGLGGLTRDSIVGLNNLVKDDDDEPLHSRRHSTDEGLTTSGSWNTGTNNDENQCMFLDGQNSMQSQASFETSLNDGSNVVAAAVGASTPRSSAAVAAATSYNKVSATNSRSLDSYRPSQGQISPDKKSADGSSAAQAAHYQGFQYEGYTDYYSEDFSGYNYDDYSSGGSGIGGGSRENKNIFCCLFAPWAQPQQQQQQGQPKAIEADDKSEVSMLDGEHIEQGGEEAAAVVQQKNEVAEPTPTLSPTPSLTEKIPAAKSLGSGAMPPPFPEPESSKLPDVSPSAQAASVTFASPQGQEEPKPTTPHMMSGSSLSTSPESCCFDEKKQEDGDLETAVKPDLQVEITTVEPEEEDEKENEGPPPIKSILKVRRCSAASLNGSGQGKKNNTKGNKDTLTTSPSNVRHLFPSYEPTKPHSAGGEDGAAKKINFNPMARVLTIPSRKDIPLHQKAQVWWQRCDYDEFKKTGRIISKAMECGGSEIWLASSNAWGNRAARQSSPKAIKDNKGLERSEDEYNKALSKYIPNEEKKEDEDSAFARNKWWCKFGHSRRGLEHIASSSEGRARQQSVVMAIRMVMEEQKRQRISRTKDPNKLRNVAMNYTSWARDLSLAAGTADAEAVASGFDPAAASRAKHFAKRLNINPTSLHSSIPSDKIGGNVMSAVTSQILDANTHFKPKKNKSDNKKLSLSDHDNSLKFRAKGYIPGGGEAVSAAAVLTGSAV